jgi:hypothetical protein
MGSVSGLPGAVGQPSSQLRTRVGSCACAIALIIVAILVGAPDAAWAGGASTVVATQSGTPTPNPDPPVQRSPGRTASSRTPVPAPTPQQPPAVRPQAVQRVVTGPRAWLAVPIVRDFIAPGQPVSQLEVGPPPTATTKPVTKAPAHAAAAPTSLSADALEHSLIYSSALALVIAGAGLVMLGSRRRLW